jgi:uncharacterized protein (TIGR03437 family)
VFRVDTFNVTDTTESSFTPVAILAGVRMWVLDGAGRMLPALMTHAEALSLEAVMPDAASPGAATLIVQPPRGPSISQPVTIHRAAPGLYFDTATVAPYGYASDSLGNVFPLTSCLNQGGCFASPLPLSSSPDGLDFVLYGTGLRGASGSVRVRIGTHTVDSVEIRPHSGIAGVDELGFHLPQDFPLRLYQAILAETWGGASNHRWIYLQ